MGCQGGKCNHLHRPQEEGTTPATPQEPSSSSSCPYHHQSSSQNPNSPPPADASASSSYSTTGSSSSPFIRFVVKDYGKGIQSSELQNIFKPFQQESVYITRHHGGTGLGLSITAKLVEALGGKIFVNSQVGEWTEFTIDIPLKHNDSPTDPVALGKTIGPDTVVLVADKNAKKIAKILRKAFAACNIQCIVDSSMSNWDTTLFNNPTICRAKRLVCLIHEELFELETYKGLSAIKPGTTLISHGHDQSHPIMEESAAHIRSPTALLPCVLMNTIVKALQSSCVFPGGAMISNNDSDEGSNATNPTAATSEQQQQQQQQPKSPPDITKVRILVAEDNLINQKVMAKMLKRLNIGHVDMVDNGKKAVDKVQEQEYDVVLMDMQMPVMDGVQACRIIVEDQQTKEHQVKVVFVSANVSCDDEITSAGAWDCVPKPFKLDNIRDCLQRVASSKGG